MNPCTKMSKILFTWYVDGFWNITIIHKLLRLPNIDNCG